MKEKNERSIVFLARREVPRALQHFVKRLFSFLIIHVVEKLTKEGKKFLVNKNLKELEEELDPRKFYRANRKYIIHINYIKSYRAFDKIKILVEMTIAVSEDGRHELGRRH